MIAFKLTDLTAEEIKITLEEAIQPSREINEQLMEMLESQFKDTVEDLHLTHTFKKRLKTREVLMLIEVQLLNALKIVTDQETVNNN